MAMNKKEQMIESVVRSFPDCRIAQSFGLDAVAVSPRSWKGVCALLRTDFDFNMLVCISAVDREKEGIEVFVHLRSVPGGGDLIVKCLVAGELPEIDSLCGIWCSAELYEDEIYDLFGVKFCGHPFLRRLFLEDDFEGYPLRKNYGEILEHNS